MQSKDLASTSELIAHSRSEKDIAAVSRLQFSSTQERCLRSSQAIGADAVIYQTLPNLIEACASAGPKPATRSFEVGVFNGDYITPVETGYFEHLERIRNRTKRAKDKEEAKAALMNGSVEEEDLRNAVAGENGRAKETLRAAAKKLNMKLDEDGGQEEEEVVAHQQDISLHNMDDEER